MAAAAGFHGSGGGGVAAVVDDNVAQHTIYDVLAVLLVADVLLVPLALQAALPLAEHPLRLAEPLLPRRNNRWLIRRRRWWYNGCRWWR